MQLRSFPLETSALHHSHVAVSNSDRRQAHPCAGSRMLSSPVAFTKFSGILLRNGLNGRGVRAHCFLDDAAVEKMDGAVRHAGVARIVGNHAYGRALAVQLP